VKLLLLLLFVCLARSVSSWFTEDGQLVSMNFFEDVKNMYLSISQAKKDD